MVNDMKSRNTYRLMLVLVLLAVMCCGLFAFLVGYNFGVQQIPEPVKGAYNITLEQGGKVTITTNLKYIDRQQEDDKLIIYGESTFDEVE